MIEKSISVQSLYLLPFFRDSVSIWKKKKNFYKIINRSNVSELKIDLTKMFFFFKFFSFIILHTP